jgi:hypothetical protein
MAQMAAIQENTSYKQRVDERVITAVLPKTKKIVILSQRPEPGGDVPRGTVVNLTLAVKDDLPMASLGVLEAVSAKWQNPAQVEAAVVNAGTSAAALQTILADKPDYTLLSDSERAVFDGFAAQQGLGGAEKARVYSDVQFAYTL